MARTRGILSCMLCLLLSIALPAGITQFAQASSVRKSSSQERMSPSARTLPKNDHNRILSTTTNTTNTTNATQSPTPATAPSTSTPPPTHSPTKQYHPSPDDEEEEGEKKETKIGVMFGWIVFTFALIWAACYFRDAIIFFLANAWNNTKREGLKGCLSSFFPFVFRSQSGGAGSEHLDQIIFESEDPNLPLMN